MGTKRMNRTVLACMIVAPLAAGLVSGCAALAAGAAGGTGIAFLMGDLEATVRAEPPEIATAAEAAIAELDLIRISSTSTQIDAEIVGRTATDKSILIRARRETDGISKLTIRVGTFGDEDLSRVMLDAIKKRL